MTEEEILSIPTVQFILQYFEENQGRFGVTGSSNEYVVNKEYRMLIHTLLSSLSKDVLKELSNWSYSNSPTELHWVIKEALKPNLSVKYEDNPKPLNTTTELLIKWYKDKSSKKVDRARKEICKRFNYLDSKDQFKILKLFLAGPLTDRMYAYRFYKQLWDKTALDAIIECWKHAVNDIEWLRAGMLIVKKASKEQLRELGTSLYINAQGQAIQQLYKDYCMRFIGDTDFIIEQQYFRNPASYYDVILAFQRQPDKDKFEYDLYHLVVLLYAEAYYRIHPALIRHQRYSKSQQFHYPQKLDPYGESRELHLCEVYDIRRMLALAVHFGYSDIVNEFVKYATKVDAAVGDCKGIDCVHIDAYEKMENEDGSVSVGFDLHLPNRLSYPNSRALPMKTFFPEKYIADLLAFEESPVCKQAAEDIKAIAAHEQALFSYDFDSNEAPF